MAALELAAEIVRASIAGAAATSENAEQFVVRILRGMAADLERSNFEEGCPIATTALETAAQSGLLGDAARRGFQSWEREIKRGLERFVRDGQRADIIATALLSQLEGALLLARTYKSLEPMNKAERAVRLLLSLERGDPVVVARTWSMRRHALLGCLGRRAHATSGGSNGIG